MSLIPARWRRPAAPMTALEVADGPEFHPRSSRPAERLTAPTGRVIWVCATPTGRVGCVHETEAQAKWHGKDVFWPEVVDDGGLATEEAS